MEYSILILNTRKSWQEYVCYHKQLVQSAIEKQSSIVKTKGMSLFANKKKNVSKA